jgi:lipoate-protein ligase A
MASRCMRLIIDPPAAGPWNMAVDEALLLSDEFDGITLRFYQWSDPTLSLGYFQPLAERDQHTTSQNCTVVRRASGGGAILHDQELTYSLVAPVAQRFGATAAELYDVAHQALCEVLSKWNIQAHLCCAEDVLNRGKAEPFLCFQRRSRGDVLLGAHKICGSAQRRHQARVLQHGSLLLGRSAAAPELPGIRELSATSPEASDVCSAWQASLARRLRMTCIVSSLSSLEVEQSRAIVEGKFGSPKWTAKR